MGRKAISSATAGKERNENNSKSTGAHDQQKSKESSKVKTGSKDTAELKWCAVHKTTSHDDAECYVQGAPRQSRNDNAHIASFVAAVLCELTSRQRRREIVPQLR